MKQNVWFPEFGLLKIVYNKNSIVHGIDHILRVWIYAQLISKNFEGEIDKNVLSAAALLHDVGRKNDFTDKEHGKLSAKWVKEFLSIITTDFTNEQIERISFLCAKHNEEDFENEPIELQILKDADALDRERISPRNLKPELLRLEQSVNLVPLAKKITHDWQHKRLFFTDSQKIFNLIIKENNFELEKEEDIDSFKLKNKVRFLEKELANVDRYTKKLSNLIKKQQLNLDSLNDFNAYLSQLNSKKDSIEKSIVNAQIKNKIQKVLFPELSIYTYDPEITDLIKHTYTSLYEISIVNFVKTKDFYKLLEIVLKRKSWNSIKAMKTYLEEVNEDNHTLFLNLILRENYENLIKKSINNSLTIKDFPNNFPYKNVTEDTSFWLILTKKWIQVAENYCKQDQKLNALWIIDYTTAFIQTLLKITPINLKEILITTDLLKQIVDLVKNYQLNYNLKNIASIWGTDFFMFKIVKFPKAEVYQYANLFNIYDYNDALLKQSVISLLNLLESISTNIDIDQICKNYVIPLIIGFNLEIADEIDKFPNVKSNLIKHLNINDNFKKEEYIKNLIEKASLTNYESFNLKEDVSEETVEPSVVMNIVNVKTLFRIVQNRGQILSSRNIRRRGIANIVKMFKSEDSVDNSRDVVQRVMWIRKPNVFSNHPLYGSLEKSEDLTNPTLLENITNPELLLASTAKFFKKKSYGYVILIFKDYVKNNCIFTYFDSCWKNRTKPVVYKEAKQLFYNIKKNPIGESLKTHPLSYPTAYIEAIIMGGATLNDVEKVIVPKKEFEKEQYLIKKIKKTYPQIEFIEV